jgi:hypothetical protein
MGRGWVGSSCRSLARVGRGCSGPVPLAARAAGAGPKVDPKLLSPDSCLVPALSGGLARLRPMASNTQSTPVLPAGRWTTWPRSRQPRAGCRSGPGPAPRPGPGRPGPGAAAAAEPPGRPLAQRPGRSRRPRGRRGRSRPRGRLHRRLATQPTADGGRGRRASGPPWPSAMAAGDSPELPTATSPPPHPIEDPGPRPDRGRGLLDLGTNGRESGAACRAEPCRQGPLRAGPVQPTHLTRWCRPGPLPAARAAARLGYARILDPVLSSGHGRRCGSPGTYGRGEGGDSSGQDE